MTVRHRPRARGPGASSRIALGATGLATLLVTFAPIEKNGFDLSRSEVPIDEIVVGAARDAIPAIDAPRFVTARDANFLRPEDRVLGFAHDGRPRAYPLRILDQHEVVNDATGPEPVAITWCPLCASGVAFRARADGRTLRLRVSGLLFNSDVLLYDQATQSLWSQLLGRAISGPAAGATLEMLPLSHTTWGDWLARHPGTLVLAPDTGSSLDYTRSIYADYVASPAPMFPVRHVSDRYPGKSLVVGVVVDGVAKAYPFAELGETSGLVEDSLAGRPLQVLYDGPQQTAMVFDARGREVPSVIAYWFAWYAFHPDGLVYARRPQDADGGA